MRNVFGNDVNFRRFLKSFRHFAQRDMSRELTCHPLQVQSKRGGLVCFTSGSTLQLSTRAYLFFISSYVQRACMPVPNFWGAMSCDGFRWVWAMVYAVDLREGWDLAIGPLPFFFTSVVMLQRNVSA